MNLKNYKDIFIKRKGLVISIAFHLIVIAALLIFLTLVKTEKKKPEVIQEIELFTPPEPETQKEVQQPQTEPEIEEKKVEVEPVQEPKEEVKPKRPAPEPFKTKLKTNVIKQWDDIEKKNLQNN